MSPRESARLLTLLNTTFKHQLDRQQPDDLPDSEHHTDVHLRSILTNPLFVIQSNCRGMPSKDRPFGRVQDLVKRPMDVFKEQVSGGTATLQSAGLCLQAQYNNCLASPDNTSGNAMRASGAGTTVLEWLWSSGIESSRHFFKTHELFKLLVPFLIAERQHKRIMQWLRRLYAETNQNPSPENDRRYRKLLLDFIKAEMSLGQGLESATALFIQVAREARDRETRFDGLNSAFNFVAYYLTVKLMAVPKTVELQASTLDPLMNISRSFTANGRGSCLAALQGLYLAKHPSARAALQYFQGLSLKNVAELTPLRRHRIIFMGLRTAELCHDRGRQAEAIQVMDFLESNFKSEIVSHRLPNDNEMTKRNSDEAEDQSLHLLDSLAIA